MAEPIARVHVDSFDPEVYRGDDALELAQIMADQMRSDFPGAVVGVSFNPEAAMAKKARIMASLGLNDTGTEFATTQGLGAVDGEL